jgi:hypothetical protein
LRATTGDDKEHKKNKIGLSRTALPEIGADTLQNAGLNPTIVSVYVSGGLAEQRRERHSNAVSALICPADRFE